MSLKRVHHPALRRPTAFPAGENRSSHSLVSRPFGADSSLTALRRTAKWSLNVGPSTERKTREAEIEAGESLISIRYRNMLHFAKANSA